MSAELIDFIDIWRAKRGLSRAQALEQMKIAKPENQADAAMVVYLGDSIPGQPRHRWWLV